VTELSFWEVAGRQRAHRSFRDEPVDDAVLARLIEAATWAPSAENGQPWEFVVVRDASARGRIGELTRRAWEGGARAYEQSRLPAALLADVDAGARGGVAAAPVLIVVCADVERCLEATIGSSIFPAAQNLLLAATAAGLGSALTTLTTALGGELAAMLVLPSHVRPVAVIPIGHPTRALGRPGRDPFAGHTHRETYGARW
jgi:nitroreductase